MKQKTCIECGTACSGIRCRRCSNRHNALSSPRHVIDTSTLTVDRENFAVFDGNDVAMPLKMKFDIECQRCGESYRAALCYERRKKHPWHCKSCAILLEWHTDDYRNEHVKQLLLAHGTPEARNRVSVQSKKNWRNEQTRQRMLDRDFCSAAKKGRITRVQNLLSGTTVYRVPHGRRESVSGICMRSSYEARFARMLNKRSLKWLYEPKWFELSPERAYLPDFYIPTFDVYVEVKGWWRDDAREKFEQFIRDYPNIRYALIMCDELEALEQGKADLEDSIIKARG